MPHCWVKDYFRPLLIDSTEAWMEGKSTGAVTTHQEVVKAIAEQIKIALTENNDSVPTDLEKVYLQYYSQQLAYCGSLSEFGFKTKLKKLYRVKISGLLLPNVTSMTIWLQSNPGHQSPYVVASIWIGCLMFSDAFPVAGKRRTLVNMLGHWVRSSESFPKTSLSGAPPLWRSGMPLNRLRMFNTSKIITIQLLNSCDTLTVQSLKKGPFRSCRMDAVHEASEWSCVLHANWVHQCCRTTCHVAVSFYSLWCQTFLILKCQIWEWGFGIYCRQLEVSPPRPS